MLLTAVRDEFIFHCECRKLSPKTIKNYGKQIDYLLNFLETEKSVRHIEDVEQKQIKAFLLNMSKAGRKANYVNDLLKVYKVFFRYAYEEEYTETLLTAKIQNVKKSKVLIRTFTEQELKRMTNFYQGYDYLTIRNKVLLLIKVRHLTNISVNRNGYFTDTVCKVFSYVCKGVH